MKVYARTVPLILLMLVLTGCGAGRDKPRTWIDLSSITSNIAKEDTDAGLLESTGAATGQPEKKETPVDFNAEGDGGNHYLDVMRTLPQDIPQLRVDAEGLLLNFDNADIYEFIQAVAGAMDLDYIIDPQVKGVVNIRSQKKIPQDHLFAVFKKILNMNGLDIRDEGSHYYIFQAGKTSTSLIYEPNQVAHLHNSPRMVIQIMPVMYLAASEAVKLISPFLSKQGSIQILPNQNTIVLADYESKVIDALNVLARLDLSPLASLNVRLVKVKQAPLFDLQADLMELLDAMQINNSNGFDSLSVVPLERLNALLLVSNSEFMLYNGEKWIHQLDVESSEGRDNIFIYTVRNSVASDLAGLVTALISDDAAGVRKRITTKKTSKPKTAKKTTTPAVAKSTTKTAKPSSGLKFSSEPLLLADDTRNIILIRAMKEDHIRLVKLLERLDNMPSQVLIEVVIAEVTLTDGWEFGVEWALSSNKVKRFEDTSEEVTNPNTGEVTTVTIPARGTDPLSYTHDYFINSSGLFSTFSNTERFFGMLNMFASDSNLSILSSPHVMVLNNETATVNIGDQVPIITSVTQSSNTTVDSVQTIQYRDTGVILTVTPRINTNGTIILDVDQQISQANETTTGVASSPTIRTRQIKTKLAIKDGQSILMGGLISSDTDTSTGGIPLLKDIPLLGWAFKTQKESTKKTELLIMITPHVIGSENVLAQYVRHFSTKMDELRAELSGSPGSTATVSEATDTTRQ